jgi:hypothetical protein
MERIHGRLADRTPSTLAIGSLRRTDCDSPGVAKTTSARCPLRTRRPRSRKRHTEPLIRPCSGK